MTLEQILGQRYRVIARLPAQTTTHQRCLVEDVGEGGAGEHFILSLRDSSAPVSAPAIARQNQLTQSLALPPLPLLCRAVKWRMTADSQHVISEDPGELTLQDLLNSHQSLKLEEAEALLRMLTDGCEAAVTAGWPRIPLDSVHLYLDLRLCLPRIPLPDIPGFDDAEQGASLEMPPTDSCDYIRPLAALCCELLGQPQSISEGNTRYHPVPLLSTAQNVLLRRALISEGLSRFAGARDFIDELFGVRTEVGPPLYAEHLRKLISTLPDTAADTMPLTTPATITVPPPLPPAVPVPPAAPPPLPAAHLSGTGVLQVQEQDAATAGILRPVTRLRFIPDSKGNPVLALSAGDHLTFGRSTLDADFVAQFRPRTSSSDARSRRISRNHGSARLENGHILFEENETMNPTVHTDGSLHDGAALDSPARLLLAGEYPLEMHRVPSDYSTPRMVRDHSSWNDAAPPPASLAARPSGPGVLLWEAALVSADIGIHFSTSGRPWFRFEKDRTPPLRVHRLAGHFWLEVLDEKVLQLPGRPVPLHHPHLVLLRDGMKIQLGSHLYSIQNVLLSE